MVQYHTNRYPPRTYPRYRHLPERYASSGAESRILPDDVSKDLSSDTDAAKDSTSPQDEQSANVSARSDRATLFRIFNLPILLDDVILIGLILLLLFNNEVHDNVLLVLLVFLFFYGKETGF